jgi:hypothetical protein
MDIPMDLNSLRQRARVNVFKKHLERSLLAGIAFLLAIFVVDGVV